MSGPPRKRPRLRPGAPKGWTVLHSRSKGLPYFVHDETKLVQWTPPPLTPTPVSTHYDAITVANKRGGREARAKDRAIRVRLWNNACKAYLINSTIHSVAGDADTAWRVKGHSVLDLACGKLGDKGKWSRHPVSFYTGLDISPFCVAEAAERSRSWTSLKVPPKIEVLDLLTMPAGWRPAAPVTVVSMQMAVAYMAKNFEALESVFALAAAHSVKGAAFVLTFPSWTAMEKALGGQDTVTTPIFKVTVTERSERRYLFSLGDSCVQECEEYGVTLEDLEAAGARHGWSLQTAVGSLAEVPYQGFFRGMGVEAPPVGPDREACSIYSGAIFVRS